MNCINIIAALNIFFVILICLIGSLVRDKALNIDPFCRKLSVCWHKGINNCWIIGRNNATADSWLNTTSVLIAYDMIRKLVSLTKR